VKHLRAAKLSPIARLAVGLVSLVVCLLLMLDFALNLFPDRAQQAKTTRLAITESLGAQLALVLPAKNVDLARQVIQASLQRYPDVLSVAVRIGTGDKAANWMVQGAHDEHWKIGSAQRSTINNIRLPVMDGAAQWGDLEVSFKAITPTHWFGWFGEPVVLGLLGLGVFGGIGFYLYLRRALQFLDPTAAVPERVRAAFDTLSDGLIVIDAKGLCVLANQTMRDWLPPQVGSLTGKPIGSLNWLTKELDADAASHPWSVAMRENRVVGIDAVRIDVPGVQIGSPTRTVTLKANPISDNRGNLRGCIITFDDITQVYLANERLRETMKQLELSNMQVQQKAQELELLASRDPLTGCLNRRAFFEAFDRIRQVAISEKQNLTIIMCDVDHFKSFNDRFGHAVGDQVLKIMASLLKKACRDQDHLVRLGGEEFAILYKGLSNQQAQERANRIRQSIELEAGRMLNFTQDIRVTSSFGVATLAAKSIEPKQLLELADQALYESKRSGRNRVTCWPFAHKPEEEDVALPI
jgi:diguanylate cyclase (GGDEF)-like protein